MLVLSRHRNESVCIGDDVVVTVIDIRGDKIRLGFEAPRSMPVHRKEVYNAIKREAGAVRGFSEEQVYGFVMMHGKHRTKHVMLAKSVSQRAAELRAIGAFGHGGITEVRFFGEANHENTQKAQSWAFEQWVGGAELVRVTECTQATA